MERVTSESEASTRYNYVNDETHSSLYRGCTWDNWCQDRDTGVSRPQTRRSRCLKTFGWDVQAV